MPVPNAAASDPARDLPSRLRFGRAEVQARERRLLVDGQPVALGARAFDLLLALVRRPAALCTKAELLDEVWPGLVVEEANLTVQVSALRKALGADCIATIPGRGYRFTADLGILAASPAAAPAAGPSRPRLRTHLPDVLAPLIGRADDLEALDALLQQQTLVTVLGAGGMGKTALALEVCARRREAYPHGVCWVDLSTLADAAQLPGLIAAALEMPLGGEDRVQGLANALSGFEMLLALDNAEHLLEAVTAVAQAIGARAPGVRLLVTSQAPLRLGSEHCFRLAGLSVPPPGTPPGLAAGHGAMALFVARAQAADRRFVLTSDNVDAVIAICAALEGSALAIGLAASRVGLMGVNGVRGALGERLKLLTRGPRDAPGRQQTLRAALEWSHGLLGPAERAVFRRMAVFAGAPDLALLREVLADAELDAWAVLDALGELVDRSLVALIDDAEPRYRLLDSPRALALEKLQAAGEAATWPQRHARALAARSEQNWVLRWSGQIGESAFWRAAAPLRADMQVAFDWGCRHDPGAAAAMSVVMQSPYDYAGRMAMVSACGALRQDAAVAPHLAGRAAWIEAALAHDYDPKHALEAAQDGVALFVRAGDALGEFLALTRVVEAAVLLKDLPTAEAALLRARALEHADWPPQRRQRLAYGEGRFATAQGDHARAMAAYRRAADLDAAAGIENAGSLIALADAEWSAGELPAARARLEQAATVLRGTRNDLFLHGFTLSNLTGVALAQGDLAAARRSAAEGWPHAARLGAQAWWADNLSLLAALEQRPRTAALLAGYSDASYLRSKGVRQGNETLAVERALALATAALGADAVAAQRALGAAVRDADAALWALAEHDAPQGPAG